MGVRDTYGIEREREKERGKGEEERRRKEGEKGNTRVWNRKW